MQDWNANIQIFHFILSYKQFFYNFIYAIEIFISNVTNIRFLGRSSAWNSIAVHYEYNFMINFDNIFF